MLLDPDTAYATADVRVLDALGDVVAGQVGGTGSSVVFYLPPKTYALRAAEPKLGQGRVASPVELYAPLAELPTISLQPIEEPAAAAPAEAAPAPRPSPPPPSRPRRPRRRRRRAEPSR